MRTRSLGRLVLAAASVALATWAASELTSNPMTAWARVAGPERAAAAREPQLPAAPYRYADPDLPAHFRTPNAERFDNTPLNSITDSGAALGRVLFYDTRLSASETVSCGSCHVQQHAFADPNRFSRGHQGGMTDRHAMNLVNLRYHPRARFFWDERGGNLESMVLMPVENHLEMGEDPARLPSKLERAPYYAPLFRDAFGDAQITTDRISRALAQFLRSMLSYRSPYDAGRARATAVSDDFDNFTPQENRGKALFLRSCAFCHLPNEQDAHFVMIETANTGLDADTTQADGGVGDVTLLPADLGRFKSPSLRNTEVSGPYMHDGRFPTLEAVLDHYSSGGAAHPNQDPRIQPLRLTRSETAALVAFLKTLTDPQFLNDPRFADPFR